MTDPGHERAGMILIRQAIRHRWDIPDVLLEQLPRQVTALFVNARNDRERLRAAEVIVAMNRDNISALVAADRIERLESGTATERVEMLQSISDAQLTAAAKVIDRRRIPDQPKPCPTPTKPKPPRKRK